MAQFSDWGSLKEAILNEMRAAMDATLERSYHDLQMNVMNFYNNGVDPLVYIRTYKLASSPRIKAASGGGNVISGMVYMDDSYSYNTGTWDTSTVQTVANAGGGNLKGAPGFWTTTEGDIPEILESEFGKRFN